MDPFGIYVHFPFCLRKCAYCDFNSRVGDAGDRAGYLGALLAEIARQSGLREASSVYFGGGTPTVYPPADLARVLEALRDAIGILPDAEITCEANPGTVSADDLRALREAGFNRLSLGVQSLDDAELKLLGRIHTADDARRAVEDARSAVFDNVSVDLIRGLPGQSLRGWDATLTGTIALAPRHISVYGLMLEDGTPLRDQVAVGAVPAPTGSDRPQWVQWTVARLAEAGYTRYEVSNYSQPGGECRHNLIYWHNGEYLGLGAGAWTCLGGERRRNHAGVAEYAEAVLRGGELVEQAECLSPAHALGETIMLGLRLTRGLEIAQINRRFGVDLLALHGRRIGGLVEAGLACVEDGRFWLTPDGLLVQSAVAAGFLA